MTTELPGVEPLLAALVARLRERLDSDAAPPLVIGIHTGGAWIARHLHAALGLAEPLGLLDISFYRDDFTRLDSHPHVRPSELPVSIDDRELWLVDDVLHTGRTIRAALNELFDYGRPAAVRLIALIDRPGRELPIQPDVVGQSVEIGDDEHIKLVGPEPLALVLARRRQDDE
ncbi:MAG: bifunctional pyr operon transcriptional regulator/uracil phosphoribosyltransferase PyrR [Chromatiales bacterium]|nr:bifunctional pyr operon transcriptional regulator/uracil phosphoribosyltransferase PyrR [Chromatiales bacterium]